MSMPPALPTTLSGIKTVFGTQGVSSELLTVVSGLAWNVGQLNNVSSNRPYINLAKQAANWEADNAADFTKNADGYPTTMENGATKYSSFINLGAEETSFRTTWRLTWDGDGTMSPGANTNSAVTVGQNEIEFTPDSITNNLKIYWDITDFGTTGISNVAVVRKDRAARYDAGEIFEPVWFDRAATGGQLRFLNWFSINSATNEPTLATRKTETSYSWGGLPIEIAVRLANETNTDFWLLLNHQAGQDYVEFFAQYIKNNLNPHLKTIVEVTNEPWNSAFAQTEYYFARGLEYFSGTQMAGTMSTVSGSNIVTGVGTSFDTELVNNAIVGIDGQFFIVDTVDSATQFTSDGGRTATKTASGMTGYFGGANDYKHHDAYVYEASIKRDWFHAVHNQNVEYVLNAQYAVTTGVSVLIDAATWAGQTPAGGIAWTPRNQKWDRIGLGLYFGGGIVNDLPKVAALQALIDVNDDAGVSALVDTYLREEGVVGSLPDIIDVLRNHWQVCRAAGMSLDVYEEGPHISHSTGTSTGASEDTMLAVQQIWRKSAECTAFMAEFFDVHRAFINARYDHFDLHHVPSRSGDWGAWRLLDDPDAATDKMLEFLLTIPDQPVWYGDGVIPSQIKTLPSITADEFEDVGVLRTDVCLSANTSTYSATGLPAGLSIDSVTGDITGVVASGAAGIGTYTVTATNAAGSFDATGDYTITEVVSVAPDNPVYNGVAWIDPSDPASYNAVAGAVSDITDKLSGTTFNFSTLPSDDEKLVNGNVLFTHYNKYSVFTSESTVSSITTGFTFYSVHQYGIAGLTTQPFARFYGGSEVVFAHSIAPDGNAKRERFLLRTANGDFTVDADTVGTNTATRLTTVVYDGATLSIQVAEAEASIPVTGNVSMTPGANARIGRGNTNNNGTRSFLGEMLICSRAHTAQEIAEMQTYFNTKYALPDYT